MLSAFHGLHAVAAKPSKSLDCRLSNSGCAPMLHASPLSSLNSSIDARSVACSAYQGRPGAGSSERNFSRRPSAPRGEEREQDGGYSRSRPPRGGDEGRRWSSSRPPARSSGPPRSSEAPPARERYAPRYRDDDAEAAPDAYDRSDDEGQGEDGEEQPRSRPRYGQDRGQSSWRRGSDGGGYGGGYGGRREWGGRQQYGGRDDEEERQPNIRDQLMGEVLYGAYPVLNALRARRRELHALYVLASLDLSKRKDAASLREVFKLAKELDLVVHKTERHELNLLSDDGLHQGLVLDCSPLERPTLETFPTAAQLAAANPGAPPPVWLALDEVVDPQNFGAVVRSAHCLGASGVLACSRNCAPMSAVVSKASAGALEVVEVHSCSNMVKTLTQAVADGWQVLGAAADSKAQDCRSLSVNQPTILVVGNEGSGLRTNIRRACSGLIQVEMGLPRQQLAADSLNVSVAAGILIHAAVGASLRAVSAAPAQPVESSS